MNKLRLAAEDLCVESFPTARPEETTEGTVHAHEATVNPTYCYAMMCPPASTKVCNAG